MADLSKVTLEHHLAQRLYDIAALEPLIREGFTLLTPNRRLARRIKLQWDADCAAAGKGAWPTLAVHTLEDWLLSRWDLAVNLGLLPPAVLLGTAQAVELWRQVISTAQHRQAQHHHLLLPSAAAEIANQARELLQRWQIDTGRPEVRQWFLLDRECDTFRRWLTPFESRLQKSRLCTAADCLAQLPTVAAGLPAGRVALLEFDEMPPLLRTALDAVCTQVKTVAPKTAAAHRVMHPFSDKRTELHAVASWAASLHRTDPTSRIGIVPSDMHTDQAALEYLLRREFDCLGENYASLPINFSTGIPLAQAPLVRDALAALAMGLSHTTLPAVVNLLHSRFLDLQAPQGDAQRLVHRLYTSGHDRLVVADLRAMAVACAAAERSETGLGRVLQAVSAMPELRRSAPPSVWSTHFGNVLNVWGWPGRQPLDSVEFQQLQQWHRTLDEFRAFDTVCGNIPYGEALALLHDCCRRHLSHPQTADSPIQVLGPLEAAGLIFDHLWLCGMQAGSWPATPRPNPFIPLSLQSRLRMPHANPERELAFSTALLARYARACHTLHASYARQIDGVPNVPSALLRDFTVQLMPELPALPARWARGSADTGLEQLADHRAPQLDGAACAVKGGSRVLEDQSLCPFRAFARHRLHIAPPPALSTALPAGQRGSLLHAALNALWGELRDHTTLCALNDAQQGAAIAQAIDAAMASVAAATRRSLGAGFWRLERQRLAAVLHEWLAVERRRSEFSVVARERALVLELSGLALQLQVDRIDELPDGSQVIIDYKSGDCSVRDWLGERPSRPQLMLYAIAEPGKVAALAFACVRPRNSGYVGLGCVAAAEGIRTDIPHVVDHAVAADWHALNTRWRDTLTRLAAEFVAGEAQVDPLGAASCDRCGLQSLCRVDMPPAAATEPVH